MKATHIRRIGLILALLAAGESNAQTLPPGSEAGSPPATMVPAAGIHAAWQRNSPGSVSDSVLRVLPIEGNYNVGVSVVRRSKVNGETPPDAIEHDAITEVYQIIEGKGVIITGGTIESPAALAADDREVRQQIGPSSVGKVIRGATRQPVRPGDVVVIPPHTPHGFIEITSDRIVYTLIRIDPKRLLELHDERPNNDPRALRRRTQTTLNPSRLAGLAQMRRTCQHSRP